MTTPKKVKLIPRGRIGKVIPVYPMDYEPRQQPYVPTKMKTGDVRAGITLIGTLSFLLFWYWVFETLVRS